MTKSLTLIVAAACAMASFAGSSRSREPASASGKRGIVDVLSVGQRVTLMPVVDGRTWDIHFYDADGKNVQGASVVFEIGSDFVAVRRGTKETYVPVSSIRSLVRFRSADDLLFQFTTRLADKLDTKIDVRIIRAPLFDALNTIGKKSGIDFEVDAAALKQEGYTQNMTQNLLATQAPTRVVLSKMLGKYGQLVLVEDAKRRVVVLTTKAAVKPRREKTAAGVDWKPVVSREALEREVEHLRVRLVEDLASLATFNTRFRQVEQESLFLAILLEVAAEHSEGVRWKERLPAMTTAAANIGTASQQPGKQGYLRAKRSLARFDELYDVETPLEKDKQGEKPAKPELGDPTRALMKRNDQAFRAFSKADLTGPDAKEQKSALAHEADMIALVAKLMDRPEVGYANDDGFLEHARSLLEGAANLKTAVAAADAQAIRAAVTFTGEQCAACHAGYR